MAKKLVIFLLFYFLLIGAFMVIGMGQLDRALMGRVSPFNGITGPMTMTFGSIILFGVPVPIFIWWLMHTPKWEKELPDIGTSAPAKVLELRQTNFRTGSRYSGTYWWRAKLEVHPSGDAPFEVTLEKPLNKFGVIQEGGQVNVKYDPNNKKHVGIIPVTQSTYVFASNFSSAPSGSAIAQQVIALAQLHQRGELSDAEFEAAKKKLLS